MSRQDKATTERHTKQLRELVKRPENRVCADCKHNDPRWASWNLGVFLCIRCSGIHRGMGTHISKVKSIDLDTWTPEQMESIMKWGNRRANLYWEAHLKPGHIPPDHKMESFIRSKYESRRWAMDGPPPHDPSILEGDAIPETGTAHAAAAQPTAQLPRAAPPRQAVSQTAASSSTTRQPQVHQLLSSQHVRAQSAAHGSSSRTTSAQPQPQHQPQPTEAVPTKPENDLFSLDFHAPATPAVPPVVERKDVKQDILSLFSSSSQTQQSAPASGASQASLWGQPVAQQMAPPFSNAVNTTFNNANAWNVGFNNWGPTAPAVSPGQANMWDQPSGSVQSQPAVLSTNDIWASSKPATGASVDLFGSVATASTTAQKKDDAFGDLWGGFK